MDPITHTLLGAGLANGLFRERVGRAALPTLLLASNLPDLDGIVHLTSDPYAVLMRRTFGHSLFLLPFWALALAWILGRRYREVPLRTLYGMTLAGVAGHLLFDLINSFGVVLFWPLSDVRPELAWVFIIDFVLTGLLALPLALALLPRLRPRLRSLSRGALAAVAIYLVACGAARWRAETLLEASAPSGADFAYVFPEPLGPHRWRGVVRSPGRYDLFLIRPLVGQVEPRGTVRNDLDDPRVAAARQTTDGRRLERFFKAPVWQVEASAAVSAWDLRFKPLVVDRRAVFRYTLVPPGG
ncbi:MAG TPA: metal-dependent hydrolase, partial [Candidatus Polarisedimenticolia bacterium]|nr:metal-dependent hydrolase [Candidatus Polarisedimenticolia bacterium]